MGPEAGANGVSLLANKELWQTHFQLNSRWWTSMQTQQCSLANEQVWLWTANPVSWTPNYPFPNPNSCFQVTHHRFPFFRFRLPIAWGMHEHFSQKSSYAPTNVTNDFPFCTKQPRTKFLGRLPDSAKTVRIGTRNPYQIRPGRFCVQQLPKKTPRTHLQNKWAAWTAWRSDECHTCARNLFEIPEFVQTIWMLHVRTGCERCFKESHVCTPNGGHWKCWAIHWGRSELCEDHWEAWGDVLLWLLGNENCVRKIVVNAKYFSIHVPGL